MPGQVVAPSADNRLEVFAVGRDNNLWHIWQTVPNILPAGPDVGWSNWANHGRPQGILQFSSPPAVVRNPQGRLELFITGIDGQGLGRICHTWQDAPNGPWPRWWVHDGPQNGVQGAPAAGLNQDGRIEVFVIESGSQYLYSQPQTAPSNGWAPNWFTFGAPPGVALASSPGVGRNADGRLAVFAVGNDGILWTKDQISPNDNWSDWISLGAPILQAGVRWNSSPVVASNADGRLELFMLGTDNHLWHQWQTAPNSGQWAWESFGSPQGGTRRIVGTPAVGSNAAIGPSGRLEAFVVTDDGAWWHRWQIAPNGGWSDWDNSFLLGRAVGHGDLAVGEQRRRPGAYMARPGFGYTLV